MVITDCMIGSTCNKTSKRQDSTVGGIRHFFVTAYTFLCQQVGIRSAETCRPVFIMNIHHQMVAGTFLNCFMQPFCPAMRAYIHKAEFYPGNSPFFIKWQQLV